MKEKKQKKFNIFNMNRDGKGVKKEDVAGPPTFLNFFKTLPRRFNKILSLNLLMLGRLPMYALIIILVSYMFYERGSIFSTIFATVGMLLGNSISVASNPALGTFSGVFVASGSMSGNTITESTGTYSTYMSIFGQTIEMPTYSALFYCVIIGLFLFAVITWGWQSVGCAYIARGLVRADPIFTFSDYFRGIKKNFKQGFFLGLIDALVLLILTVDFCYLYNTSTGILFEIMLWAISGLFILYLVVRKYIYLLAITFDMKIFKIFKNALIFTVLGIKRNLLGSLSSILLLVLNIILGIVCLNFNFIIPLILPLVYFIGMSLYISAYSVYPVIDKYMIEPYKKAHPEEVKEEEPEAE